MSRPGGVFKDDLQASAAWGRETYKDIPKSVFALVAWHLANLTSDGVDVPGMAVRRFREEVDALAANGLIKDEQAKRVIVALAKGDR